MSESVDRRHFITTGTGAAAVALTVAAGSTAAAAPPDATSAATHRGAKALTGGRPFPLTAVTLLPGACKDNQSRNNAYLRFVDIDRLLHTFRLNAGLPSGAQPCGGWESPTAELRGHSTGHLLSGLALTYAATGDTALRDKGRTLVSALAACRRPLRRRARGGTRHRRHRRARPLRQPPPRRLSRQVAVPGPVPQGRLRRLPRIRQNAQRE
ncbi:beta-L-arabinofuranosidase domain-containing protein [Streptomyces antimycoticus]|uniref:beta-L-arabinofuranosidase domain-containing protein n=1 Tax=Streptomyces antimycoticus TaxID=68175 RepID=UPI00369DB7D3